MTDPITFAKFEPILEEFAKFKKFRHMKVSVKMLEPHVNYRKRTRVNHDWLKLRFPIKKAFTR